MQLLLVSKVLFQGRHRDQNELALEWLRMQQY